MAAWAAATRVEAIPAEVILVEATQAAAIPEAEVIPAVIQAAVVTQAEAVIQVADIEVEAILAAEAEDVAAVAEARECPGLFSTTQPSLVLTS